MVKKSAPIHLQGVPTGESIVPTASHCVDLNHLEPKPSTSHSSLSVFDTFSFETPISKH